MKAAVVIPTYDRAEMVVQAVRSALAQTAECRVVVVDDGSTDDTLERLETFGDEITVLARENRERGAARNAGAREASDAELLCFVDADDLLGPGHVAQLVELAGAHPDAPLVCVPATLVDETLSPLGRMANASPGPVTLRSFLLGGEVVPPSATGVRREPFEEVGGFDERRELAGSEDWLLTARLLARGAGVRGEDATVLLRRHAANTMADADAMRRSMLLAHRIFFDDWWSRERELPGAEELDDGVRERSRARLLVSAATQYYAAGRMSRARSLLLDAAREDPSVVLEGRWAWTWLRSLLGGPLSSFLRSLKRRLG